MLVKNCGKKAINYNHFHLKHVNKSYFITLQNKTLKGQQIKYCSSSFLITDSLKSYSKFKKNISYSFIEIDSKNFKNIEELRSRIEFSNNIYLRENDMNIFYFSIKLPKISNQYVTIPILDLSFLISKFDKIVFNQENKLLLYQFNTLFNLVDEYNKKVKQMLEFESVYDNLIKDLNTLLEEISFQSMILYKNVCSILKIKSKLSAFNPIVKIEESVTILNDSFELNKKLTETLENRKVSFDFLFEKTFNQSSKIREIKAKISRIATENGINILADINQFKNNEKFDRKAYSSRIKNKSLDPKIYFNLKFLNSTNTLISKCRKYIDISRYENKGTLHKLIEFYKRNSQNLFALMILLIIIIFIEKGETIKDLYKEGILIDLNNLADLKNQIKSSIVNYSKNNKDKKEDISSKQTKEEKKDSKSEEKSIIEIKDDIKQKIEEEKINKKNHSTKKKGSFEMTLAKDINDRLSQVKGIREVKEEIDELIEMIKNSSNYTNLGIKLPKGILLCGKPGTGKTLIARAIAGESGVNFIFMTGSDFDDTFVGVGSKRIRELFEYARKNTPCIIFIDEIDSLLTSSRRQDEHSSSRSTLNQFLSEMDGFNSMENVYVIGATNHEDSLDKAAVRPGRFDKIIHVPMPNKFGREEIIDFYLDKIKLDKKSLDKSLISLMTPGFSGADIENLINLSIIYAVNHNKKEVNIEDISECRDRIMMGIARKSFTVPEKRRFKTALHEAGHALVCYKSESCRETLHKLTVIPRGPAEGVVSKY